MLLLTWHLSFSDFVESSNVHRLNIILKGCDVLLQDVSAHLRTQENPGEKPALTAQIHWQGNTHLVIFHHAANLQLLNAVTHRDQFGYTHTNTNLVSQENFLVSHKSQFSAESQIIKFHLISAERWWVRSSPYLQTVHQSRSKPALTHHLVKHLQLPQSSPSICMLRTHSSSLAMSVSSSQGLTSNRMDDLAMSAGSVGTGGVGHHVKPQQGNRLIPFYFLLKWYEKTISTSSFPCSDFQSNHWHGGLCCNTFIFLPVTELFSILETFISIKCSSVLVEMTSAKVILPMKL